MVYAFTEAEKKVINNCGYYVVEFKLAIKKISDYIYNAVDHIWKLTKDLAKKLGESIEDFTDSLSLVFKEKNHNFKAKTSHGYNDVYILSKCNGIERKCVWKLTRPVYLPRSNC